MMANRIPERGDDPWPGPHVRVIVCCEALGARIGESMLIEVAPRDEPTVPTSHAANKRAEKASRYTEPRFTAFQFGLYLVKAVEEPVMGGTYAKPEAIGEPLSFCPYCGKPVALEGYEPELHKIIRERREAQHERNQRPLP